MAHTIVFHLIKVSKKIQNALGLKSDTYDLSPSEASTLLIIDSKKDTSQIDIALKLHLKPASIVSLIDELEKLNLVSRKTTEGDRRKYDIQLTEKGKEGVKKIRFQTNRIEELIRSKLTENEIKTFFNALEKLSDDNDLNLENFAGKEVKNEIPSAKREVAS
ncbi:hypothetical protein A3J17_05050 [Candidatus Curtissbacteria bacterium RIFCSPLOWO2_02_FULL_40_11]|uniref:HTH marR-type domain-containing protein n=2 Tax=Candidatus Curtissiibacteriota TaxID=1752717 RepID=A0A1F5G8F4_9BACT|nr:MAG: hypothetical protein A3D04_01565 [Candidatus Curtissbacteria bacterium RIFCSPHIGHO2_02_FULL_40_16b]OGD90088.1 MAG: hypothetical protein A3E11_01570 [Candidatus Curtissbacteria bacterium RIFCSPHIGHO2_12_FULL_38_37]OGE00503.1 MAG: hypothetical protein A3J17_05050 [Candidatus Curtissbacteria bacterium RIFCSPLOWO2_02_FULL_40_11]OGE13227.1 MAG: hypothetical protein A3G14_00435 [Candidatus Curtissbacteria bacterium RIFCSPLOWO2_12_FULL_38_9]